MVATPKDRSPVPPTEVTPKAKRRSFSAEYKLRVLAELDACTAPGSVGAVLRREGIYSSHVTDWRRARDNGELVDSRRRGRKPRPVDARDRTIAALEIEIQLQKARADRAEALVDLQKKVADLLRPLTEPRRGKLR